MSDEKTPSSQYESFGDITTAEDYVRFWLQTITLAKKHVAEWQKSAKSARDIYTLQEGSKKNKHTFNVLYANIQTICPAVYNQLPIPDVRRRYSDGSNPVSKTVSQVVERVLSYTVDSPSFDSAIKNDVLDCNLLGRGVSRLQYEPVLGDETIGLDGQLMPPQIIKQTMRVQHVDYRDFVHDTATSWDRVNWVAFRHKLTKDQIGAINPDIVDQIQYDCAVEGYAEDSADKDKDDKNLFKRAMVWEIWDKARGKVLFIAESYKDSVLSESEPPIALDGFFPCPCPIYATNTGDLKPVVPYDYYKTQAEELNRISARIIGLLGILKYRGVVLNGLGDAFAQVGGLDDGEFSPVDDPNSLTGNNGGLDKAVWTAPVERIIQVLRELTQQREQTRQVIYEITGIADIMRGSSNAGETLGAQQIKAQWGAMRLQSLQRDVQRYIRDFMRMMAEVISEHYQPDILSDMAGIPVDEQIMMMLRDGISRNYRIDIETDSTVQADAQREQGNMTQFASGIAQFLTAVVPLAQQGAIPPNIPIVMTKAFARAFKLGREVEDALDALQQQAEAPQQQPMPMMQEQPMMPPPMAQGGLL